MRLKLHLMSSWFFPFALLLCSGVAMAADAHRTIIKQTTPVYPELARRMHVAGTVILHVTIDPNGRVSATQVESGHPLLGTSAQEAVREWRFSPSTEASEMTVQLRFNGSDH